MAGMSGAPVYYNRPSGSSYCTSYCSMAIHTNGSSRKNLGTRITKEVFEYLTVWKDAV